MSSTCWSFSSISFLESELMRLGKGETDLSEMFVARYSMIRKIHRHLKLKGTNFFTPGGQFHDVAWVIKNFGMMPEESYPGKPMDQLFHNHAQLDTILSRFVSKCVNDGITELDDERSRFVNDLLDQYLGKVPSSFSYKDKIYTAFSFRDQFMELNMDDFVEITSYTHHSFYKKFVLEDKYNWTSDEYWNLPLEDLISTTKSALDKGFTVGWDGDATDEHFNFTNGLAYLNINGADLTNARQVAFNDQTTLLDHMMHIVGYRKDKTGKSWYYIKNSWGRYNAFGGFLYMREDYFSIRTVAIIVNRSAIPRPIRSKMGL